MCLGPIFPTAGTGVNCEMGGTILCKTVKERDLVGNNKC